MNLSAQNVVDYLRAAAGAILSDDSSICLANYEEGGLVEKFWAGTELFDQYTVTPDVRNNTPAVYLLNGDKRYVFAVDSKNILRRYEFNIDDEEWAEAGFGEQPITVHTSSKLSGGIVDGNQFVLFENGLNVATDDESEASLERDWKCQLQVFKISAGGIDQQMPSIPLEAQKGTRHATLATDDGLLHLLYIHMDGRIHHLQKEPDADEFNDVILPGSILGEDQVENFLPILYEDGGFGIYILSSLGKLIQVDKDGTKNVVGDVIDGTFIGSGEECVNELISIGKKVVKGGK